MKSNESQQIATNKKPYEKPQVVYKQLLEAMAASCTSVSPNSKESVGAGCDPNVTFS